jgi:nickel transport protein
VKTKSVLSVLVPLFIFCLFAENAFAHGIDMSAFVDGDAVRVECGFGGDHAVENGKITVTDFEDETVIHEGVTDHEGVFRFRPSDEFLATGHGLIVRLDTDDGHGNEKAISAAELRGLSHGHAATPQQARPAVMDTAELEAAIGKMLDEKLSPIRRTLARQQEQGPGLRDIVGGIGWILGLLGLATYMKYRR